MNIYIKKKYGPGLPALMGFYPCPGPALCPYGPSLPALMGFKPCPSPPVYMDGLGGPMGRPAHVQV